jgi:mono/diheme cytochrome c family protein
MNYPIWDVPASGLLIAAIAVIHVFVSHFAVGGGLFLVLAERRARRAGDVALLEYVERHSRFFVLLTLVFGALTGVGIWFTIGLVHPAATSTLIQLFVWFWAIEWTFFLTEIAAALAYYYGWQRLPPRTHLKVGWIYFWSAWMSLVVINGILTFMLTPGGWIETRNIWAAFFNPTYLPALVARSAAALGLAGLYALLTASWMADATLKQRLTSWVGRRWVLPAALALPVSLLWYLWAAARAGIPVGGVFGAAQASLAGVVRAVALGSDVGHPIARLAALASTAAGVTLVVLLVAGVLRRPTRYGPAIMAPVMACGLVAFGGAEFVREDLRKPFILVDVMFVNAVRVSGPVAAGAPESASAASVGTAPWDPFTVEALSRIGLLGTAKYVRPATAHLAPDDEIGRQDEEGRAVFRLLCRSCHTVDGYLAVRPLVSGRSVGALDGMLAKLAIPVDGQGQPVGWDQARAGLSTWRGRQMPPFAGTIDERRALAVHLALLGGATPQGIAAAAAADDLGRQFFEDNCAMCHGADAQFPFRGRQTRSAEEFAEMLGRLPEINEMMPPFGGTPEQRLAVAAHLAELTEGSVSKEGK